MVKFYWDNGAYCDAASMKDVADLIAQYGPPDRIKVGDVVYKDDSYAMGFIAESGHLTDFHHYKEQRAIDDECIRQG